MRRGPESGAGPASLGRPFCSPTLTLFPANKWGLVADRLLDLANRFLAVRQRVQGFLWRLLELHVFKLVALYTMWVALKEVSTRPTPPQLGRQQGSTCCPPPHSAPQVSVMNLLLVVLWAFALPYSSFRPMASCLATVWTCIVIVCKMLYQLRVVNPHEYSKNCSEVGGTSCLQTIIWQSPYPSLGRSPLGPNSQAPRLAAPTFAGLGVWAGHWGQLSSSELH